MSRHTPSGGPPAGPTLPRPGGVLFSGPGALQMLSGPHRLPPSRDIGVGPALLAHAAAAGTGSWLRLYCPAPTVALSRLDSLCRGFAGAVEASRAHGFTPVLRSPGGRAVAYHEGCVCLEIVSASPQPRAAVTARFVELADILVEALGLLGVDARVGPIPGEYCPGPYSVNAAGRCKLVGTAQRIVRGGWLMGAAIVVSDPEPVRGVVTDVYDRLELDCDPSTVGAASDLEPGISVDDALTALRTVVAQRTEIIDVAWPPDVLHAADSAAAHHPALAR